MSYHQKGLIHRSISAHFRGETTLKIQSIYYYRIGIFIEKQNALLFHEPSLFSFLQNRVESSLICCVSLSSNVTVMNDEYINELVQ